VLLMVGSPMGAAGFGSLAAHFTDRTVVTYDPRGLWRSSVRRDGRNDQRPEDQAADLHALKEHLAGDAPVDVFGSSGGAVAG
jgi:pimeloyl-ACP methyl ester carboxylesterase